MKKLSQKGFTIVEGLLLFVIVAVIFGVGFYVYRQTRGNDDLAQQSNKPAQKVDKEPDEPEADKPPEQKYFEIPQLGVKFAQPDSLRNLYYDMRNTSNVAYLSLTEFKGTDCAADKISVFAIAKDTEASLADEPNAGAVKASSKVINDFYYSGTPAQANCAFGNSSLEQSVLKTRAELIKLLPSTLQAL